MCRVLIIGAGGVGTVGEQCIQMGILARIHWSETGYAPAQPVVREADGRYARRMLRLVLAHPAQLRQRV